MHPSFPKPLLPRLPALLVGLALGIPASLAGAQTAPAANALPEIQRLMKQGQLPQALEKVDSQVANRPKDAQARFLKGLILTEMGRQADAIAVFTRLTEDFPELPEPYNNLAVLYAQQKQYDKARTALEMAIRTHPSYSIAHENLGDVYAKLASQAYGKALQIDGTNAATQSKLSLIHELISTSPKPASATGGPSTGTSRPASEAPRPAAEAPKPAPAPATVATVSPPPAAAPVPSAKPAAKVAETPAAAPLPTPPSTPARNGEKSVAKAAEKAAEPSPAKPSADAAEAEVVKALQGWASAWSRKDVRAYLGYYAADFQTPKGVARKAWETERAQRIDKPGKLQVEVEDIKVSINGDKATVRFRQNYKSASLKSSAGKVIVFIKSGNKWLIQQERVA